MNKTLVTFPDPDMPTIIPATVVKRPNTGAQTTYSKKDNIDKYIRQKLRKKGAYKTDMHKIYNIIVGQKNKQLQEKASSDATFQLVNTGQKPLGN